VKTGQLKTQDLIFRIKVGLLEVSPLVWRRFLIPSSVTLNRLHLVLQDIMGWQNYHLYQFQIGPYKYSVPDPDDDSGELDFKDSRRTKLGKLIIEKNQTFIYEYDFGDRWIHQLLIEDILKRDRENQYPVCLEGENSCPPEDSGGPFGYSDIIEIIQNPANPEYKDVRLWLGKGFDPRKFDLKLVNKRLSRTLL
jgi:hypothetical protein